MGNFASSIVPVRLVSPPNLGARLDVYILRGKDWLAVGPTSPAVNKLLKRCLLLVFHVLFVYPC